MNPSNVHDYSAVTQDEEKTQSLNLSSSSSEDVSSGRDFPATIQTPSIYTRVGATLAKIWSSRIPWILSTILFFCTTLALSPESGPRYKNQGSFEIGFKTDFSK